MTWVSDFIHDITSGINSRADQERLRATSTGDWLTESTYGTDYFDTPVPTYEWEGGQYAMTHAGMEEQQQGSSQQMMDYSTFKWNPADPVSGYRTLNVAQTQLNQQGFMDDYQSYATGEINLWDYLDKVDERTKHTFMNADMGIDKPQDPLGKMQIAKESAKLYSQQGSLDQSMGKYGQSREGSGTGGYDMMTAINKLIQNQGVGSNRESEIGIPTPARTSNELLTARRVTPTNLLGNIRTVATSQYSRNRLNTD